MRKRSRTPKQTQPNAEANATRAGEKNTPLARGQTADEPHVFVSVGFCLSGIRIAGSPRAG
ncbi:hypothetical protein, partial [Burkholderia pseudomallei]|uniref:hypothetical protein n=1 Tax=Burkholderia pseudomallei TaxID=28450 RepID=UPI001C80E462